MNHPLSQVEQQLAHHLAAEAGEFNNKNAVTRQLDEMRSARGYLFDLFGDFSDDQAEQLFATVELLINPRTTRDNKDAAIDALQALVDTVNTPAAQAAVDSAELRNADELAESRGYYQH